MKLSVQLVRQCAFGCLVAAQHSWLASGAVGPLSDAINRAMATIAPRTEGLSL
ncbi:hypothetical protein [Micromonospora sp. NPDC047527]|uniref:hypothetical protein n=1 Tax=Micromonospora sp. NPDC047527 TaxID=3155144 RepID=UPI0033DB1265